MRNSFALAVDLFIVSIFALCFGCGGDQSPEIVFVLPAGTKGVFAVSEDQTKGMHIVANKNVFVLEIPKSGELFVKDASFLSRWHTTTVYYADKHKIRVIDSPDEKIEKNTVACWGLYSTVNTSYYFIGTNEEFTRVSSLNVDRLRSSWLR